MSQQQQIEQPSIAKVAYVAGVAENVTNAGLAKWASLEDFNAGVEAVASKMAFDPEQHQSSSKIAGQVAEVVIKLAEAMYEESEKEDDDEEEKTKERKEVLESLDSEEEKKEAMAYFALCDLAQVGAMKLAAAMQGQDPGTNAQGNSLSDAAAADSMAAIDQRHRPENYAAGAPDRELGAEVGNKSEHANSGDVGKTAAGILAEITKEAMAQQGQDPGTNAQGNSLSDAAAADSMAAIDQRHRPENYAAGAPDRELGAEVGNKSDHPNKTDVGKTAQERFEETAKQAMMHPVFGKLDQQAKIAHVKVMMNLPLDQRRSYLTKLAQRTK